MSRVGLPHHYTGKVRDLYEVGHDRMLMVASDRISVFDVVLGDEIPDKGRALTALSTFWFEQTSDIWPNHLVSSDPTDLPETAGPEVAGRAMLVRAARPVRLECIARGYLFGSAWAEYEANGTVCGAALPPGLHQAEQLPEPIFTTTTKAEEGHDETLTDAEAAALVGDAIFERCREAALAVYRFGAAHAAGQGLILADTKLEFGTIDDDLDRDRRDAHVGLVAVLGSRGVQGRDVAALLRQAVRPGPLPGDGLGPNARPHHRCPPR